MDLHDFKNCPHFYPLFDALVKLKFARTSFWTLYQDSKYWNRSYMIICLPTSTSRGYKVPCPMCHGGKFAWKITKSYFRAAWLHQADEAWNNTRSSSISPNLEFWHFCVPPISHLAMMNATQMYCFPLKKECNFKDTFLFPLFSWPCSDEWRLWKKVN